MMRALVLLLTLAACSPATQVKEEPTPTIEALAPEPQIASPELNYGDAGQHWEVSADRPFAVVLSGESYTGLIWNVEEMPSFISEADEGAARLGGRSDTPGHAGRFHAAPILFRGARSGLG